MDDQNPRRGDRHEEAPQEPHSPLLDETIHPDSEGFAAHMVGHLQDFAEPVANVVGPMASALGTAIEAAGQAISNPGELADRIHRAVSAEPLSNLYEVHPEARMASPRELGLRFIPIEEIRGTAVAGHAQRGSDFLPLRPYRGDNWQGRWQRIRDANERLAPLPPIDLMKFGGEYWVLDGHNRVAAALQDNAAGLDAMVTELVPLDGRVSERPTALLPLFGESQAWRAATRSRTPAVEMRRADQDSSEEPEPVPRAADPKGTSA
ncbi:MAG: hypothetical protein ABSA21_06815 [Candidatus Limnocylindrales bacterium]|jgi:hypothetical protein